ncbi:alpha/beta hydrolase [Mycolicibacterium fluoranthenivorans]|uniref:Alpha/beta hydrolase n=1 Tax=Mycolicibacterium fluoranthenivorans TaxID=258505 RepID=A0A7G8PAF6_9MYCO|nr:alpha/beta hydrolase [Mycolicibacterium fluoranthenivorans]QNJ91322.1 alpha/beta hydrolase [Mycolicibacterium fluoranthenivorans]
MSAMWLAGRIFAMLLALPIVAGVLCAPAVAAPESVYGRPAVWGSCQRFLGAGPEIERLLPTAQCADVAVPVDWNAVDPNVANPQGAQAQLAVIRVPASGQKIGTLMVNPGGPGASAVDTVAGMAVALAGSPIAQGFDLVGFDPRGVGYSTPQVRCRTDAEFDAYRREPLADYSPAGVAHIEDVYRQFAQSCLDRMGPQFLASIGTASAARDMDVVRAALGEEQISYLGFSYGTELGAAYADRYPDRVRAMVLDGAVDPGTDPINDNINQLAGFQAAFNDYAADCARSPDCPLGTDPAQFSNRYHQLIDPLVLRPGGTSDPRGLGYADAITGTANALYTKRYWKYLTSGLLGLARGTDAGDLLTLADEYWNRDPAGHYGNQQDAFAAIRCVDGPYPKDPAVWAEADQRARAAAPFMEYGTFTGYAPRDICSLWPVPPTTVPHDASPLPAGKAVVVSTTRDPATPYQAGVDLARELDASLITFDGTQHTVVFNGDACVDTAVVNFLTALTPPPAGLQC